MPTRLIVWNVNRFSINTINDSSGNNTSEVLTNIVQSIYNNGYLRAIGSTADIFVVIEVQSTRSTLGTVIGGSGEQGTIFLLNWLRLNYNANWCVVPPLKLVGANEAGATDQYTEGIAVFFRNDRVNFTGPYIWPAQGNVAIPAGGNSGAYPQTWANALPAQNYNAGQFEFFQNPQNRTGEFEYISGNYRRPFLTNFSEVATGRAIKLLSVHPSPFKNTVTVVNNYASIVEIQPSNNPQVVVVAGDFNVNIRSTNTMQSQGYWSLINEANFVQRISSSNRDTGGITSITKIENATPTAYLTKFALDNIFVRYDGGLAAPGPMNPRIINPVTGTDEYPIQMIQSLANINTFYTDSDKRTEVFQSVINYGHIAHFKGVSDHLPLVIDI